MHNSNQWRAYAVSCQHRVESVIARLALFLDPGQLILSPEFSRELR